MHGVVSGNRGWRHGSHSIFSGQGRQPEHQRHGLRPEIERPLVGSRDGSQVVFLRRPQISATTAQAAAGISSALAEAFEPRRAFPHAPTFKPMPVGRCRPLASALRPARSQPIWRGHHEGMLLSRTRGHLIRPFHPDACRPSGTCMNLALLMAARRRA